MKKLNYKKTVIVGIGKTGISCVNFLYSKNINFKVIDHDFSPKFANLLPKNTSFHFGSINEKWILESTLIIISPGIKKDIYIFKYMKSIGVDVISDIELFLRYINKPIVAITGSNGKSTVTSLVGKILKNYGLNVKVGGNIGIPVLDLISKDVDIYLLEISSFQLEYTYNLNPIISTILNVKNIHIDRYPLGIKEYRKIKLKVYGKNTTCIVNEEDNMTKPNKKFNYISFGYNKGDYSCRVFKKNVWLSFKKKLLLNCRSMKMSGKHNYLNSLTALSISDVLRVPYNVSLKTIKDFKGLPYRQELIKTYDKVLWINDSKSTNIYSTISALNSFKIKRKIHLILGGEGRFANFGLLKKFVNIKKSYIYCYGKDGNIISSFFKKNCFLTKNLENVFYILKKKIKKKDIVLFSPACASTDQFENFEKRGKKFSSLVNSYKKN
ncbi:MAG: UDP-N-acetylmuramoyl-L-alanine--D-glutamate ligase [Enterobacteriaceae bacterium]